LAASHPPGGARSNAAILGQVGFIIAVPIAVGAWLGLQIDGAAGTSPIGLLGLIFVGMVIAGVGVGVLIKRYADENPEIREKERRKEAGEDEDR